jgi:hypothetical protein
MKRVACLCAFVCVVNALAIRAGEDVAKWNGLYAMCQDVAGFSGEFLELKDGKFRYWFYSDVVGVDDPPKYPLEGRYKIEGEKLTLDHKDVYSNVRTLDELNGIKIVWREDGLKHWKATKSIHPYAVIIWTQAALKDDKLAELKRPALDSIKSAEVKALEEKAYQERFNDMPLPVRELFRDQFSENELERDRLRAHFAKFRKAPDPELFKQLVGILSKRDDTSSYARYFLGELIPVEGDKTQALGMMVDAISLVNPDSLENFMVEFMDNAGVHHCSLKIPESGIWLEWELDGNSLQSRTEQLEGAPKGLDWRKEFKPVIAACEKWCRAQIAKIKEKQK